jgi:hypothetical protein
MNRLDGKITLIPGAACGITRSRSVVPNSAIVVDTSNPLCARCQTNVEVGDDERPWINTKRSNIRVRIRRAAACAAARACKYQRKYKRAIRRRGDQSAGTD